MLLCTDAFLRKLGKRSFMFKGSPKSLFAVLRGGSSPLSTTILGCGLRPLSSSTPTALGSVFLDLSLFHCRIISHDHSQAVVQYWGTYHLVRYPWKRIILGAYSGRYSGFNTESAKSRGDGGDEESAQSAQSADDEASFRGHDDHGQHLGRRPAEARNRWYAASCDVSGRCLGSFSTAPR